MIYLKGVLFLIVVIAIFIAAFRSFNKEKLYNALILIVIGGFILRGWCIYHDGFLFAWDERYHALVAKNLAKNPFLPVLFENPLLDYDYRQWTMNHVWLHKQPLSLWLMAGSIKLLGASEWAIRLPSLLLSTMGIYLTFRIAAFFKDEKTGLLAAFFQAVNGLAIEIATGRQSTDHPDNVFFFFIELAVWCTIVFLKRQTVINLFTIGLCTGLAVLSKWLPALIVLPIFVILNFNKRITKRGSFQTIALLQGSPYRVKQWLKIILNSFVILFIAALVALPWQFYIFYHFPQEAAWEYSSNMRHFTEVFEGHNGSFGWHLIKAMRIWNELIYLALGWFLYKTYKEPQNEKNWVLICWISVPYLLFSMAATKMIAYPLFTAPAIFTVLAMFWWHLYDKPLKIYGLNQLILTTIIVLAVRYGYERMWLFKDTSFYETETQRIKSWNPDSKTVIFNLPERYIETMFYSSVGAAYPFLPDEQQIDSLKQKGYKVWIVRSPNLTPKLLSRRDVLFIEN